jgi:hypothetical protein
MLNLLKQNILLHKTDITSELINELLRGEHMACKPKGGDKKPKPKK